MVIKTVWKHVWKKTRWVAIGILVVLTIITITSFLKSFQVCIKQNSTIVLKNNPNYDTAFVRSSWNIRFGEGGMQLYRVPGVTFLGKNPLNTLEIDAISRDNVYPTPYPGSSTARDMPNFGLTNNSDSQSLPYPLIDYTVFRVSKTAPILSSFPPSRIVWWSVTVPTWIITVLGWCVAGPYVCHRLNIWIWRQDRRERKWGRCGKCNYDLSGLSRPERCPECGKPLKLI